MWNLKTYLATKAAAMPKVTPKSDTTLVTQEKVTQSDTDTVWTMGQRSPSHRHFAGQAGSRRMGLGASAEGTRYLDQATDNGGNSPWWFGDGQGPSVHRRGPTDVGVVEGAAGTNATWEGVTNGTTGYVRLNGGREQDHAEPGTETSPGEPGAPSSPRRGGSGTPAPDDPGREDLGLDRWADEGGAVNDNDLSNSNSNGGGVNGRRNGSADSHLAPGELRGPSINKVAIDEPLPITDHPWPLGEAPSGEPEAAGTDSPPIHQAVDPYHVDLAGIGTLDSPGPGSNPLNPPNSSPATQPSPGLTGGPASPSSALGAFLRLFHKNRVNVPGFSTHSREDGQEGQAHRSSPLSSGTYARWALTPEHERASAVPMQDLTNTRPSFREFPIVLGIREDSHISVANLWPSLALIGGSHKHASDDLYSGWSSTHDYDPRWDYESELRLEWQDHPLVQAAQTRLHALNNGYGRVFAADLTPHNAVGMYAYGTSNEPAILFDPMQHAAMPTPDEAHDQTIRTIDHEYRHAQQEQMSGGEPDWDEGDAEDWRHGSHKVSKIPSWEPGSYGKWVVLPDGTIHDWKLTIPNEFDPGDGRPGHGEYIRAMLPNILNKYWSDAEYDNGEFSPGWIDPHGEVSTLAGEPHQSRANLVQQHLQSRLGSHNKEAAFNVVPHEDPQPELSDPLDSVPFLFHSPTRTLHIGWPGGYHDDLRQKLEVGHTSPDWYEGWTGRLDGSSPTSVYYTGPEAHSIAHGQMTNALQDHFGVPMVPDRARWKFAWDAQAEPQNPHDWTVPYMATNIYGRSNIPFLHYPHSDHTYFSPAGLHDAINTRQEDMGMSNLRGRLFVGRDKGVLNWYDRGVFPEHNILQQRLEQQIGVPFTHKGQGYYLREGSEMWKLADWNQHMWKPGVRGKGIIDETGQLHTWPVDHSGYPWHENYYHAYGIHPATFLYLDPDGTTKAYPKPGVKVDWDMLKEHGITSRPEPQPWALGKTAGETYPQTVRRWQTLGPLDHSDLVHTFPDGHTIHRLHSYGDVGKVGLQLVNCWKGRAGFSDPSRPINQPTDFWDTPQPMHYMSLHDPNDVPRVGFYVHDNKVQEGFAARNKRPAPEHLQMLKDYAAMNGHEFEEPDYDHPIYQEYHFGEPAPGIQGTMGEGIPAGRMAGDANPWSPYYHVTLPMHRDSILQRGLEPREPLGGGMGSGVYVYKDRPKTWPMLDMWEIDPQHYKWEPDYNTEGAVYSPQSIDPAHMRLIPDKMAGGFTKQDMFTCGNCGSHAMSEPTKMGNGWSQTCTVCGRSRMVDPTHPFIRALMMMDPQYPAELQELNVGRPMNVFGSEEDDSEVEEIPEPEPVVASKAPATRKIIVRRDTDGRIASIDAEDGSRSLLVNRDSDGRILEIEEVS